MVNGTTTEPHDLPYAGLPQRSPLLPILFLLFNADLVQTPITKGPGALAFVDDVTAWVIGSSAGANVQRLQTAVVPKVEHWEAFNGATFQLEKTMLIHFTKTSRLAADAGPGGGQGAIS